jgi:hypothetical protein
MTETPTPDRPDVEPDETPSVVVEPDERVDLRPSEERSEDAPEPDAEPAPSNDDGERDGT